MCLSWEDPTKVWPCQCSCGSYPTPSDYHPVAHEGVIDPKTRSFFQQVFGSLLYLMLGTHPNIVYAMIALSKHVAKLSKEHVNHTFYICHYLLGTQYYSLVFHGPTGTGLIAYIDSNWASDLNTRRSQTGWFIKLAGWIFSWQSCQQSHMAYSSTAAEYVVLSDCSKQVVWICTTMEELGYTLDPILICGDNQGSVFMANNLVMESHFKHIDLRWHGMTTSKKASLRFSILRAPKILLICLLRTQV